MFKRFFWAREERNATAEIDFVYQYDNLLIPVEVKSGEKGKLKSLHLFMEDAPHDIAIRISSLPFSIDTIELTNKKYKLYNIPFYGISQIDKVLSIA